MKVVVINRPDRPERLKESQRQFEQYGLEVEVFPAIIDSPGWKGCRDSHLAVLEKYRNENFVLIFEDDILFLADPMPILSYIIENELPFDWDMLYLGISPNQKYDRISPHLFRVNTGYCAHAILYNNKKDGVVEYILMHRNEINKWDVYLSDIIHKKFNCFVIYPLLCVQWQHKSDTCKRTDSSLIFRNYSKYVG